MGDSSVRPQPSSCSPGPPPGNSPAEEAGTECAENAADIAMMQAELAAAAPGSAAECGLLADLAAALVIRFEQDCRPLGETPAADLDAAIGYVDRLLAGSRDDARGQSCLLSAIAHYYRFLLAENPADLDVVVSRLSPFLADHDVNDPPVAALALLGEALALRYRTVPAGAPTELADLAQAIKVNTLVRPLLADDDPDKVTCVMDLGTLLYDRHLRQNPSGGHADLSAAIACFRWLQPAVPDGEPILAEVTVRLGMALAERVLQHGNAPADVDEAITALASAARLLAADDVRRQLAVLYLGVMLGVRFTMHHGGAGDRTAAIARLRAALAPGSLDDEQASLARVWLSQLLILRFVPAGLSLQPGASMSSLWRQLDWSEAGRVSQDLSTSEASAEAEEAITHLNRLVEASVDDPETVTFAAVLLGTALLVRGSGGITQDDLDRAIRCFNDAAQGMDSRDGRAEFTAVQAWLLSERASRTASEADVERAAGALARARDLLSRDHPLRPPVLYYLAKTLGQQFARHPSAAKADAAIEALSEALRHMADDHPLRTETLALLGAAFLSMSQFDVARLPVDRVVEILAEADARPSADPAVRAVHLLAYGEALHLQASRDPGREGFALGMAKLEQAAGLLPEGHHLQRAVLLALASMLADEYTFTGNLESLDASRYYLDMTDRLLESAGVSRYDPAATDRCSVWAVRGHVLLHLAARREDLPLAEAAIADLEAVLAAYPPGHPFRGRVSSDLGSALLLRAILARSPRDILAAWPRVVAAAEGLPAGSPDRVSLLGRAGMMCVAQARMTHDLNLFDRGIGLLREVATAAGHPLAERSRLTWGLGYALTLRHEVTSNPEDLDDGIATLEEAAAALAREPGNPVAAVVLADLAEAYHARGDTHAAVRTGLAALREQAGDVLLQSSPQRALTMARRTSAQADEVAGWAVAAHERAAAVEALELGRGLVLHAATALADLPARLRAAGHDALADEWSRVATAAGPGAEVADLLPWDDADDPRPDGAGDRLTRIAAEMTAPAIPSGLRHRALMALERSGSDGGLLDPPGVPEIAAALRSTGRDVLAYLVIPGDGPGCAVLVTADQSVDEVPLPELDGDAVRRIDRHAVARQDAVRPEEDERLRKQREARWRDSLHDLCGWAWDAAVGPLLSRIRGLQQRDLAYLTLIPCGKLAAVPWHAARTDDAGRPRRAIENGIFSFAASARQLIETVGRARLPAEAGAAFVADPVSDDIPWAILEARYIRAAYYPGSCYLASGLPDRATPARVLERMPGRDGPGASLLHLTCHAMAGASPERSYLRLAGEEPLPVSSILQQARGRRADAPGGLVVLSACMSDLAARDYDESLTLATAFLAAGAVSVVGSRWHVLDIRTAILMFMFHHYLRAGEPPAFALRSAQLWMLRPQRDIPEQMPRSLSDEVALQKLDDESVWAAFVHQGQ
jgi:tetratricopeptide (TPR) repeat protein